MVRCPAWLVVPLLVLLPTCLTINTAVDEYLGSACTERKARVMPMLVDVVHDLPRDIFWINLLFNRVSRRNLHIRTINLFVLVLFLHFHELLWGLFSHS